MLHRTGCSVSHALAARGSEIRLFFAPTARTGSSQRQLSAPAQVWTLALGMRCVHPPGTPHSVTHDVTSASIDYNETDGVIGLVAETLRPINRDMPHLANERRLPFAPHQSLDAQRLAWEYNETLAFRSKHLAKDPRARPDWVIVTLGHNERCTSCEQDAGLQQSLHGSEVIDIGGRTQLLVDDWAVHSWQNVARVLEPPQEKRAFDIRTSDENQYGCPCSSMETEDGRVTLIYNGGDVHARRTSADGVTDWSDPEPVLIHGRPAFGNHDSELGTLDVVPTPSLPSRNPSAGRQKLLYLGGYQGKSGTACIASSSDGRAFDTMASTHDVNSGSQHWDRLTCQGSVHSALGRAGDTYVHLLVDQARQRELVWYRNDFGTPGGWREIRGIRVAELNQRFADIDNGTETTEIKKLHASWYLDRLGKLEHFRRQAYAVTLTPYSEDLWLGLMTVIEWAKDVEEPRGDDLPAFERDTLSVYLVTSRDGVHIDCEWVYARQPLLPKDGLTQADWDGGMLMPGVQLMTREHEHRMYFEGRAKTHHEHRWGGRAQMGTATWPRDQLVGIQPAHPDAVGLLVTKSFRPDEGGLRLVVDVTTCGSQILVEVWMDGHSVAGRSFADALPVTGISGSVMAGWQGGQGLAVPQSATVQLRFKLTGAAKLYAFQMVALPSPSPLTPRPPPVPPSPPPAPPPLSTPHSRIAGNKSACVISFEHGSIDRAGLGDVTSQLYIMHHFAQSWDCASLLPSPHTCLHERHNNGIRVSSDVWWTRYYDLSSWSKAWRSLPADVQTCETRMSASHLHAEVDKLRAWRASQLAAGCQLKVLTIILPHGSFWTMGVDTSLKATLGPHANQWVAHADGWKKGDRNNLAGDPAKQNLLPSAQVLLASAHASALLLRGVYLALHVQRGDSLEAFDGWSICAEVPHVVANAVELQRQAEPTARSNPS